jgi:hypothetical protein
MDGDVLLNKLKALCLSFLVSTFSFNSPLLIYSLVLILQLINRLLFSDMLHLLLFHSNINHSATLNHYF